MRVLISTTANEGHFGPLLPLARALVAAGHSVRVAAPESFGPAVARAGLDHVPFADAPPDLIGPVMGRLPSLSFDDANATVLREVFGRIDAQAAFPAVSAAIEDWHPAVLIREPAEFGSLAAAVRTGVPHLQVAIGMSEMSRLFVDLTAEPLMELAATAGLPEAAVVDAAVAEPVLSSVPELLDRAGDGAYDGRAVTFRYRDEVPGPAGPSSAGGDPGDPWVYVTFGSVTGSLLPFRGVFRQALEGLADLPVRVFMTVGRQVDVADLGPLPANARVEGWWPQQDVLALASVVLGHGGFGTTMGAVAAGVPQVVAPIFSSDQVVNARHVAAVGVGRAMSPGPSAISSACEAVSVVLAEPGYGVRAQSLAAAVAALPPAADAVSVVERAA